MMIIAVSERPEGRAFIFLALCKGSTHFFEYIVSLGAGVRVDLLGGVCSGLSPWAVFPGVGCGKSSALAVSAPASGGPRDGLQKLDGPALEVQLHRHGVRPGSVRWFVQHSCTNSTKRLFRSTFIAMGIIPFPAVYMAFRCQSIKTLSTR